jgi:hypothetical protein
VSSIRQLRKYERRTSSYLDGLTTTEEDNTVAAGRELPQRTREEVACVELELYNVQLFISQLIWSYINRCLRIVALAASAAIPVTALSLASPITAASLRAVVVVLQGIHEILKPDRAVLARSHARAFIYRNIMLYRARLSPYDSGDSEKLLKQIYIDAWET